MKMRLKSSDLNEKYSAKKITVKKRIGTRISNRREFFISYFQYILIRMIITDKAIQIPVLMVIGSRNTTHDIREKTIKPTP